MTEPTGKEPEMRPCSQCGGEATNQFAETGADEYCCINPDCPTWPKTWKEWQTGYCWKQIDTLLRDRAELVEALERISNQGKGTANSISRDHLELKQIAKSVLARIKGEK